MPADSAAELLAIDGRHDVFKRITPVVADDVQRRVGMPPSDRRKRANQIEDVAAIEDRSYVKQSAFAAPRLRRDRPRHTRWDHMDGRGLDAEMFDDFTPRELRDRNDGASAPRR